jgi:hypothetical protein
MNRSMRVIATTGFAVLAGLTFAGPVQASASTDAKPGASRTQESWGRDRVVGYYRTLGACALAGRVGQHFDRWDYFNCDPVRVGFHRGVFALEVEQRVRLGHGHAPVVKPSGVKGDNGYGGKDKPAKNNGVKDDGYGGKDNGTKDDGVKDDDAKDGYGAKK